MGSVIVLTVGELRGVTPPRSHLWYNGLGQHSLHTKESTNASVEQERWRVRPSPPL